MKKEKRNVDIFRGEAVDVTLCCAYENTRVRIFYQNSKKYSYHFKQVNKITMKILYLVHFSHDTKTRRIYESYCSFHFEHNILYYFYFGQRKKKMFAKLFVLLFKAIKKLNQVKRLLKKSILIVFVCFSFKRSI